MANLRLLTERQWEILMGFPPPNAHRLIARYYLFSTQDLRMIQAQLKIENQLAYALHLAVLRYPGRIWQIHEPVPEYLLELVAEQLGLESSLLQQYKHLPQVRRDQLLSLRQHFGFRHFNDSAKIFLRDWLLATALSTDKAAILMSVLLDKMRAEGFIIPALSQLETFLSSVIQAANQDNFQRLTAHLTTEQKQNLEILLSKKDETQVSYLTWLQGATGNASIENFLTILDRLTFIRKLAIRSESSAGINPNRLSQLARRAQTLKAWRVQDLRDKTEVTALLMAFVLHQETLLIDQALEMFLVLYQQIFKRAKNAQNQGFLADSKSINQHLHQYARLGKALIAARKDGQDVFQLLDSLFSWEAFSNDIEALGKLLRPKNFDYLEFIGSRYSQVRRFSPIFLQSFEFQGQAETEGLRQALRLIREVDTGQRPALPLGTASDFVDTRWQNHVFVDGKIQRRYFELCALTKLREHLRSGDIWVNESQNFRHLSAFLIPQDQWQMLLDAQAIPLAVPLDPLTYLRQRHEALHEQLQIVDEGLANQRFPQVELLEGRLKIGRISLDIPSDMKLVRDAVYRLLPRIRITDLLLEVDATVHFSQHFTHAQTAEGLDHPLELYTLIIAGAINLGIEKMALSTSNSSYERLAWLSDWFIRNENYSKAQAELAYFQFNNPFAQHWGSGSHSSSDSQYFPVGTRQSFAAQRNPYYGTEPGIAFYTHVSDQHSPFYTQVISTRLREAPYMLHGLLQHETNLEIQQHSTDTKGFTDHIFALCHLLGFRFAPRIRNFKDLKLATIKSKKFYPTLAPLLGSRINTRPIYEDWLDLLWIATSLRLGSVTAPVFVQRLAAYPRQNRWAKTLKELGRLERSFFALQWIQDLGLRQTVYQGLYKGEARNALARAVSLHRLGRIHERSLQAQNYHANALNLVVTAIILWNTVYIEQAVQRLRHEGWQISEQHLNHLTPLGWEHINLTGDYVWNSNLTTSLTNLRDLQH